MALALLTGARGAALASLKLRGKLLFLMAVLKDDKGRDVRAQILGKIGDAA